MINSDSKDMWNYILKSLIILDRCVEEKLFLWEISDLTLESVEFFKDKDEKIN